MGKDFKLGKFTAAQCGTDAVRFCCAGYNCNGKSDSVFLHHSVI